MMVTTTHAYKPLERGSFVRIEACVFAIGGRMHRERERRLSPFLQNGFLSGLFSSPPADHRDAGGDTRERAALGHEAACDQCLVRHGSWG